MDIEFETSIFLFVLVDFPTQIHLYLMTRNTNQSCQNQINDARKCYILTLIGCMCLSSTLLLILFNIV